MRMQLSLPKKILGQAKFRSLHFCLLGFCCFHEKRTFDSTTENHTPLPIVENLSIDDNFSRFLSHTDLPLLSFFKNINLVKMKFTAAATALFLASASAFAPRNAGVTKAPSTAMNA